MHVGGANRLNVGGADRLNVGEAERLHVEGADRLLPSGHSHWQTFSASSVNSASQQLS